MIFIVIFWLVPVIVGALMGNARNKLAAGILLPLFLGWIGVVIIACLSDRSASLVTQVHVHNTVPSPSQSPEIPPADSTDNA